MKAFCLFLVQLSMVFCVVLPLRSQVHDSKEIAAREEADERRELDARLQRVEYDILRLADPQTGVVPSNAIQLDRAFLERFQERRKQESALAKPADPLRRLSATQPSVAFRPVGPGNVGGRTTAFAVDYKHTRVMLAGGATGGIWRSIDAGSTWTRVSDQSDIQNVSCIVQDPVNAMRWYAGTGEVLSTTERRTSNKLRTILTGSGIYRSDDGGLHWQRISPTINAQPNTLNNDLQAVWRLIPTGDTSATELYAACYGGIYRYRKGVFEKIAGDSVHRSFCTEIALSANRQTLYAAFGADDDGVAGTKHGIWRSRDAEHEQWENISPKDFPSNARRIVFATAPSNESLLYTFVQTPVDQSSRYTSFSSYHYLWRYQDSVVAVGRWQQCKAWLDTVSINTLAGYAMCMAVHPTNENTVYLAGTDLYRSNSGFVNTRDGVHLGGYPYVVEPGVLHPDLHCLFFPQQAPYYLYAAGDGGIAYLEDAQTKQVPYWKTLNNGYDATQCYSIAQDEFVQRDSLLCVSLQDNSNYVTRSPGSNLGWTFCYGGDGTCAQVCAGGSSIIASSQYAYSMYSFGFDSFNFPSPTSFGAPPGISTSTAFVSTFRLLTRTAPNDTILALAAGNKLYHFDRPFDTNSYGIDDEHMWHEWTSVPEVIPASANITAICQSKVLTNTYYLGCSNSRVYSVTLSGTSAVVKALPALPVQGFVSSIDCDTQGSLAVSLSNYTTRCVFASLEDDYAWKDLSDELRDTVGGKNWGPSVRCVRFFVDPKTKQPFLLAGTSVGLFSCAFSESKLGPWTQIGTASVGSVIVECMSVRDLDSRLLIGTHGAGVYEAIPGDDTNGVDSSSTQYFGMEQNYPNPVRTGTQLRYFTPSESAVLLELYDALGARVAVLVQRTELAGEHRVEIGSEVVGTLASGMYYFKLTAGGRSMSRAFNIVR